MIVNGLSYFYKYKNKHNMFNVVKIGYSISNLDLDKYNLCLNCNQSAIPYEKVKYYRVVTMMLRLPVKTSSNPTINFSKVLAVLVGFTF